MNQKVAKENIVAISGTLQAAKFIALIAMLLTCVVYVMLASRPKQTYFIFDRFGGEQQVIPQEEPNVTPSALLKWATQAATNAYTIDFFNYRDNLEDLRDYFTVGGYQQFLESLDLSGRIDRVVQDKLIVSAVSAGTAVILQEGPLNGLYIWRIQVPLHVTYQGASVRSTEEQLAVNLLVTKVPTDLATKGIGIAQIIVTPYYPEN